jgi:hypothetical protein
MLYYGGFVPLKPSITMTRESVMLDKTSEPRHIKLHIMRRGLLFGYLLDKTNRKLHIFLAVFDLEIPLKEKK